MVDTTPISERRRRKRAVEYALRLGEDERDQIRWCASQAGLSMAHFIRRAALQATEPVAAMSAHDAAALIRTLTRVGVDLNQLTRAASTGQGANAIDLAVVVAELRVALKTIAELRLR